MAENGNNWIKLNRSIMDHWLWTFGEIFSRGQAFIDLLLMAAYADHPVMSQGKKIDLKRGSMVTSIRYLSDRWRWSKDKTMHFLNDLAADGTIKKVSDTKRTVLTIVNYDKYQGFVTSERTQNGHKTDAERTQNGQTKERKESKRNISNTWQRNHKTDSEGKKNSFNNFQQRSYDTTELEKRFAGNQLALNDKEDENK